MHLKVDMIVDIFTAQFAKNCTLIMMLGKYSQYIFSRGLSIF